MGKLRDEFLSYLDVHGLVGSKPNQPQSYWTGGNQLLETYTGLVLMHLAGECEIDDLRRIIATTRACEVKFGLYDKNPRVEGRRRVDDITHDDIIGVSMGSSILGLPFAQEIVFFGESNGWVFNNNQVIFTSNAKPWHRSAYLIAAGKRPDLWSYVTLLAMCVLNALTAYDDASGKRLVWLILEATSRKDYMLEIIYRFWKWRVRSVYGSLKRIFIKYHGEDHPYAKYCPLD